MERGKKNEQIHYFFKKEQKQISFIHHPNHPPAPCTSTPASAAPRSSPSSSPSFPSLSHPPSPPSPPPSPPPSSRSTSSTTRPSRSSRDFWTWTLNLMMSLRMRSVLEWSSSRRASARSVSCSYLWVVLERVWLGGEGRGGHYSMFVFISRCSIS